MITNTSKYQLAIFEEYKNTRNSIVFSAVPGSGKTATLLSILEMTPRFKRSIFLAFNKSIKEELQSKVPEGVITSTIHALGLKILVNYLNIRVKVVEIKNWIIGKQCIDLKQFKNEKSANVYLFIISRLIDLYRMNCTSTKEDLISLAEMYNIDFTDQMIDDCLLVMQRLDIYNSNVHAPGFMIDFVDMLYLAIDKVPAESFPKYDVVVVDELQDLNPLQKMIIERLIAPHGRFIGAGDEKQAIYSFQGSNLQSFKAFQERPHTTTLPLSVCYRCGTKIIEKANTVFNNIEPYERAEEGVVIERGSLLEVEEGDFILCRNNLPLFETFIQLLIEGKRVRIMGKDFGKSLQLLLDKVSEFSDEEDVIDALKNALNEKIIELKNKGIRNPTTNKAFINLQEKVAILTDLIFSFQCNLPKVQSILNDAFSEEPDRKDIILSTIHKAKGLEADNVFLLGANELIPSQYAETQLELYQEKCLLYVALTRAKKKLIIVPYIKK